MNFLKMALLMVSLPVAANCQINESDTVKFEMRTSVTGNYQQGNVALLAIRSKLDVTLAPVKDVVIKSQNNSLYQAFNKKKADNDIFSRNYIYYKPRQKIYPFAITYISANYRRKIDFRYFTGAGITWQVLRSKRHILKLSASTVYEQTNFNDSVYNFSKYNNNNSINTWRGTAYLGGWNYLIQHHLRLYYDAFWQPAFTNSENYRTQFDIGADFIFWKGLSFNILYSYTHENVVVRRVTTNDRILTFGLAYQFRKKQ